MRKKLKNSYSFALVIVVLLFVQLLYSCIERNIDDNLGNSRIYFTNSLLQITFRDSATLVQMKQDEDTTILLLSIYRSGVSKKYDEITVKIEIDSLYLASMISSSLSGNELFLEYKNSEALGDYFCSIPHEVTIPEGDRRVVVPLTISKSKIKLYKNDYFNYTLSTFNNGTPKDRKMIIPLVITNSEPNYPVLESKRRCNIEILKQLTIID